MIQKQYIECSKQSSQQVKHRKRQARYVYHVVRCNRTWNHSVSKEMPSQRSYINVWYRVCLWISQLTHSVLSLHKWLFCDWEADASLINCTVHSLSRSKDRQQHDHHLPGSRQGLFQ